MNTPQIPPQPASTYQRLLDAASAWPDGVATQWIPDPGAYTDRLAWTYADLAATVTQIASALTALGVRRAGAVTLTAPNTAMLYAATLAAQAAGIAATLAAQAAGIAAARAAADILAEAGLSATQVAAAYENGRLVITVTGADPGRVHQALAGFPLTVRTSP